MHRVQRIVLYDNGSNYWSSLGKELAKMDEEVEIILVNWPYKHGPMLSLAYEYLQIGKLNHFRLFFGATTNWCINLDIDEFLYFDSDLSLKEYLHLPESLMLSGIMLPHHFFPSGQAPANREARFYHHYIRCKSKYWDRMKNPKYICQPNLVSDMMIHAYTSKRLSRLTRLLFLLKKDALILKNVRRISFLKLFFQQGNTYYNIGLIKGRFFSVIFVIYIMAGVMKRIKDTIPF